MELHEKIKLIYGTQRKAAVELGLNEQTLSNYCTGKSKPKQALVDLINIKLRDKLNNI